MPIPNQTIDKIKKSATLKFVIKPKIKRINGNIIRRKAKSMFLRLLLIFISIGLLTPLFGHVIKQLVLLI
jgi:hypothetical protein